MSPSFTDSHLHFDSFHLDHDLPDVISRARGAGVDRMVAIGGTDAANALVAELADAHPGVVFGVVGYDRDEAARSLPLDSLRAWIGSPGIVGVGETGLDYYYGADTAGAQRLLFERMLELAAESALPAVVHSRDADEDTIALLSNHVNRCNGRADRIGVLHCFTGTEAFARRLLDLGMYISFSGIITFRNADALRAVARIVPEDRILIETDAPYLAPDPYRGKRNEPAYVVRVAEAIARVRDCTVEEIALTTSRNADRLFGMAGADG